MYGHLGFQLRNLLRYSRDWRWIRLVRHFPVHQSPTIAIITGSWIGSNRRAVVEFMYAVMKCSSH